MIEFLVKAEEYVAHHEPDKTAEEIFTEFVRVGKINKKFNSYIRKNKLNLTLDSMPRKSEAILERRRLFINWYVEQNNHRFLNDVVEELTTLVFASETTIHNVIYNYR